MTKVPLIIGLCLLVIAIVISFAAITPQREQFSEKGSFCGIDITLPLENATRFENTHSVQTRILNISSTAPGWIKFGSIIKEIGPDGPVIIEMNRGIGLDPEMDLDEGLVPTSILVNLDSEGIVHYTYLLKSSSTTRVWLGIPAAICCIIGFGLSTWGSALFLASYKEKNKEEEK